MGSGGGRRGKVGWCVLRRFCWHSGLDFWVSGGGIKVKKRGCGEGVNKEKTETEKEGKGICMISKVVGCNNGWAGR